METATESAKLPQNLCGPIPAAPGSMLPHKGQCLLRGSFHFTPETQTHPISLHHVCGSAPYSSAGMLPSGFQTGLEGGICWPNLCMGRGPLLLMLSPCLCCELSAGMKNPHQAHLPQQQPQLPILPLLLTLFINNFNIVQSGSKQETLLF